MINLPFALFVIAAGWIAVPESSDSDGPRSIDVVGAVLVTAALGGLTFGLIRLQGGTQDLVALASTALGVLILAAFGRWEKRAPAPMIPLHIFRNVTFAGANLYTFFLYAALGGSLFFVPFDLQDVHRYSPAAAGAAILPFIIIMFAFARWSGGLVGVIGARIPLVAGAVVAGFGFLAYARVGVGGSYLTTFFPAAVLLGLGGTLFVAPLTTTVMDAIDTSQAGIASGINNAVARVAGLLAIAALGIVLSLNLYAEFDRNLRGLPLSEVSRQTLQRERPALGTGRPVGDLREPDRTLVNRALAAAYTSGFRSIMVACAFIAWFAAIIAYRTVPAGRRRTARPQGAGSVN